MVGISVDVIFIKEVSLPRDQLWDVKLIRCFQEVKRGQGFHLGSSFVDFQHTAEHNAMQRHAFHDSDEH